MSSPREFFGTELRRHREALGLTLEEVGTAIGYDLSYVSAIERGKKFPKERKFADGCDQLLKTDGLFFRTWVMARDSTAVPSWFEPWRNYERDATMLRYWAPQVVPGLFQDERYAYSLLRDDAQVGVRMDRQQILLRQNPPPPYVRCVIDEAVLWRPVGGKEVMHAQLLRLAEIAAHPSMSVQIAPLGVHDGLQGGFVIASLDADDREVAYVETAARGLTMSSRDELVAVTNAWESVRSEAFSRQESIDFILRTAEEKWT